ncbi:TRAP transporter small permease [Chelativorans sp. AA-79]|uniref:TRAP transporter small permease n=1 Tax=Chelativorans sp. AA-79 TaxID=3028735 RepID=UPI0023F7C44C|nr:TRAP transporter small permease [Chelativorans sp. AA-79]WEX10762.1 TRAP transporter small permease [Chelativorans sp. AA-79]
MMTAGTREDPVNSVLTLLSRAFSVVAGGVVLLMMLHVTADVLLKYFLRMPIVGTLEIVSNYYMVAAIFLPLAAIERSRGHLFVELFTARLGPRPTLLLDAFGCLALALFAFAVTWMTTLEAIERTRTGEMIDAVYYTIPIWPTRWFPPLGCGLLVLMCLSHAFLFVRKAFETSPSMPETHQEEL